MRFIRSINWNTDVGVGGLATCLSKDDFATKKQSALQFIKLARFSTTTLRQPEEIPKREAAGHVARRSGQHGKALAPPSNSTKGMGRPRKKETSAKGRRIRTRWLRKLILADQS
jgi:hypothetical protein